VGPDFVRFAGSQAWELAFPRPDAERMEYQLELTHTDNRTEFVCDPHNELRAAGPFGDKSVLEFPAYRPPSWIGDEPAGERNVTTLEIPSRALHTNVSAALWSTIDDPTQPLPLLVVHDGGDYADYSLLLTMLERAATDGRLPPMRAALLVPVDRDHTYSASAAYTRALVKEILPALGEHAPTPDDRRMRVGVGASLGALALLHAHRNSSASFGGLFLQSGSYFRQRFDPSEFGFVRFQRISRFVGKVLAAGEWPDPIRMAMTCGSAEENLANNRAMRDALVAQGYEVAFHENRDAHNWTAWRDCFDPHLVDLLTKMWQ
jgi:enterochelin esterase-like enzyme